MFDDLRQFKNSGSPTTVDGKFKYGRLPSNKRGSVVLDPGSFEATPAVSPRTPIASSAPRSTHASNTLMIDKSHSANNRPLMVGGPQIGYNYPGFTYEIDMDAPGLRWRGATSAPFPGYLLIGRGVDFATTLTSSSGDIIDQFAEKLCGGSDRMYVYKGKCRTMEHFNAGTLDGEPVEFDRTVHGPVIGYATSDGQRYAISSKRSSYGKDTLDQLFYRRLSTGKVDSRALVLQGGQQDTADVQLVLHRRQGRRDVHQRQAADPPSQRRPGPAHQGDRQVRVAGFLFGNRHIHGKNPGDGTLTNWNNISAHGFGAADDNWGGNGSAARVDLLDYNLDRLRRDGEWSLAEVTSAMNAGATQDVRAIDTVPLLRQLLDGAAAPSEQAQRMLDLLGAWRANGGNRLDLDGDGLIDDPGAAIMDAAWPRIADAFMRPRIGRSARRARHAVLALQRPARRAVRRLVPVLRPRHPGLLGSGSSGRSRTPTAAPAARLPASRRSGSDRRRRRGADGRRREPPTRPRGGRPRPRRRSRSHRVNVETMAYSNRPSGIQQVISFRK